MRKIVAGGWQVELLAKGMHYAVNFNQVGSVRADVIGA